MLLMLLATIAALLAAALLTIFIAYRLPRGPSSERFLNLVVGHRGCRGYPTLPENSIAAFKYAIQRGCDAIELDVQLSADGEAFVVHDDLTTRLFTTEGKYITQMSSDEVRALRYKANATERVPTLRDVFVFVNDFNRKNSDKRTVKIFVELKNMNTARSALYAQKIAADFAAESAADIACIITFAPVLLYHVRVVAPALVTCLLYADDVYCSALRAGYDIVPAWVRPIAPLVDAALLFLCRGFGGGGVFSNSLPPFLPAVTGASMMGPNYKLLTESEATVFTARGLGTYVWVTNTVESALFCLSLKCSVGTDHVFPDILPPPFARNGVGKHSDEANLGFALAAKAKADVSEITGMF